MISLKCYHNIPILGFAAYSGTGKTTLLEQLIPELQQANIRVAMVKHSHHEKFDIDKPGKDSHRLRKAGADQVLIASARRWALMVEEPLQNTLAEPNLFELLAHIDREKTDLILVEGFRHEAISKIELHRPSLNKALLYLDDPHIIAIATDHQHFQDDYPDTIECPILDINNISEILAFINKLLLDVNQYESK